MSFAANYLAGFHHFSFPPHWIISTKPRLNLSLAAKPCLFKFLLTKHCWKKICKELQNRLLCTWTKNHFNSLSFFSLTNNPCFWGFFPAKFLSSHWNLFKYEVGTECFFLTWQRRNLKKKEYSFCQILRSGLGQITLYSWNFTVE